jgi:hypothetical protein
MEQHLNFLQVTDLTEEQANLIIQGLETFVGVVGNTLGRERPMH